jgi:nitrate/nitrite transport system ATP-binding protein
MYQNHSLLPWLTAYDNVRLAVSKMFGGTRSQDSVMAIHQKLGNTVLMIIHDVDEAVLLSDRIGMMTSGPAARIGEVMDVPMTTPRRRLELAASPTYLKYRQRVLEFLHERHGFVEAA